MKRLILVLLLVTLIGSGSIHAQNDVRIGYLVIPSIRLYRAVYVVPIVDRHYSDTALVGRVGWLQDTAWLPDDFGPLVLAGHRYGVFRDLDQVRIGDTVIVFDQHNANLYRVTGREVVQANEWQLLVYTSAPMLLLVTCDGDRRLVIVAYRQR